ncbi:MAG: hypothetical protein ABI224_04760 [Acetobacteraceae bacterium]
MQGARALAIAEQPFGVSVEPLQQGAESVDAGVRLEDAFPDLALPPQDGLAATTQLSRVQAEDALEPLPRRSAQESGNGALRQRLIPIVTKIVFAPLPPLKRTDPPVRRAQRERNAKIARLMQEGEIRAVWKAEQAIADRRERG